MTMYHYNSMGHERPHARKLRGEKAAIPSHHPFLSDYAEMIAGDLEADPEAEQCAWPEWIDQRTLASHCHVYDFEDAEDDDPAGGDVCDEPHDAREEDGI